MHLACSNVLVYLHTVDCEWTTWGSWSNCTHPCGGGTRSRSRGKGHEAQYGGDKCVGENNEDQSCNTFSCPHSEYVGMTLILEALDRSFSTTALWDRKLGR